MVKTLFASFVILLFINIAYAQKNFNVTIKIDSSFIPKNVHFSYNNGKDNIFMPDTFGNKRVIVLKGQYYSQLAYFSVDYTDGAKKSYGNNFFITDKPTEISFRYQQNDDNKLPYTFIKNATPVFDTAVNKSWKRLTAFLADPVMAKENQALDGFFIRNKDMIKNDSLALFRQLYKPHLDRAMLFLKRYPDDYFSFWYFINQVAQPNSVLRGNTAYLKEQLAYLKTVFPAKYTSSIEGKELIDAFEKRINPLKLNEPAPPFNFTTIDGKKIDLKKVKGKYVLLDFWATWCAPCMAEMPFIKEIRKNYSADKLVIIGISKDSDLKKLKAGVKKNSMTWPQFYDQNNNMSKLYEVDAIPALVLIDREGKIIYKSDMIVNDKERLPKILQGLSW